MARTRGRGRIRLTTLAWVIVAGIAALAALSVVTPLRAVFIAIGAVLLLVAAGELAAWPSAHRRAGGIGGGELGREAAARYERERG